MSTNPKLDYPSVDFSGDCGESGQTVNSVTSSGMQPYQSATINGGPANNCIIGFGNSVVYNIWLTTTTGLYDYQIAVDCQGPDNRSDGFYFHLGFTDGTGDTYYLKIHSSDRETHTVDFNSTSPGIVKIWWCDYPFGVKSPDANNPDHKVAYLLQE